MKNLTLITLFLATLAFTVPAQAGSGHSHDENGGHSNHGHSHGPVDSNSVKTKAVRMLDNLVNKGVIDKSWRGTQAAEVSKKTFSKGEEWVVSFNNDKISDKEKQTLYIFFSLDGHYIAANYSGK